jgi:hypothetical protein
MKHFVAIFMLITLTACQKQSSSSAPAPTASLAQKSAVPVEDPIAKCSVAQIDQYNQMQATCAKLDSTDKAQVCLIELEKFKKNNGAIDCQANTSLDQKLQIEIAAVTQFDSELKSLLKK